MRPISLGLGVFGREEIDAVVEVLERRGNLRMGRRAVEFERKVAALLGKARGIMLNSGSSAVEMAVRLLDLPEGSEVVTPTLTFSTTVAPLLRAGLVPAFVDVEPGMFVADPAKIEEMIGKKTRAVLIPNLIGNVPDWDRIREIADRHDLRVVEDSCDTLGAMLRGRPPGERAHISVTSFNQSHVITCLGTGGLVAVDDEEIEVRARLLRNWGRSSSRHGSGPRDAEGDLFDTEVDGIPYHRDFVFEEIGFNLEPNEVMAAFGLAQLDKLAAFSKVREENFAQHAGFFARHRDRFDLPRQLEGVSTNWMCYPIVVREDAGFTRVDFQRHLEDNSIIARPIWTGNILRHPGFRGIRHRAAPEGYPVSDDVMRGGVLIASYHGIGATEIDRIHEVVEDFLAR